MSAPLEGHRLGPDIEAGSDADPEVPTAAATIALRGPIPAPADYDPRLTVGERARLRGLPQPLISTGGCTLVQSYVLGLAPPRGCCSGRSNSSVARPSRPVLSPPA
ncbi:urease accessory protein UreD [Streptomyces sp. NPDC052042]|uniref:urease accessory protein UreD n=1 Tax=Streptomyces sp. NPDC052042 TaxID=3365683 RepID=UPI0037D27AC9